MKKFLFALLAISLGITANAQLSKTFQSNIQTIKSQSYTLSNVTRGIGGNSQVSIGPVDTIFRETFSNGFSGDGSNGAWTNHGTSTSGTATVPANWEYRGTTTTPNNTVGSQGGFINPNAIINSPTRGNGFMIFDSDYLNSGSSTDPNNAGTGSAPTPHWGGLQSPSIDLSGQATAVLALNTHMFRHAAIASVAFSTNGGTSWHDTLIIHGEEVGVNDFVPTATSKLFDISSFAAGQADVRMRFIFDGANSYDGAANLGYYYWQIDDIVITTKPDYDLEMLSIGVTTENDTVVGVRSHHYSHIPKTQAPSDTLMFAGRFKNNGKETQQNLGLEVTLNGNPITSIATSESIAPNGIDSIGVTTPVILPATSGVYNYNVRVFGDSTDYFNSDNTERFSINVTDTLYNYSGTFRLGVNYNQINAYEVCLGYEFWQQDMIDKVEIQFGSYSSTSSDLNEGDAIKVTIKDSTQNTIMEYKNSSTADFYIATSEDANKAKKIYIPVSPTGNQTSRIVQPGIYYACYSSSREDILIATLEEPEDVWVNEIFSRAIIRDLSGNNWRLIGEVPAIGIVTADGCDDISASITVQSGNKLPKKLTLNVSGGSGGFNYNWSGPNNFSATTKDVLASASGNYAVTIEDAHCSVNDLELNEDVDGEPISVGDVDLIDKISVYPNPNNGIFNVETEGLDGTITISVSNVSGQVIYTKTLNTQGESLESVDLKQYGAGVYFIKMEYGDKSAVYRVTVQ